MAGKRALLSVFDKRGLEGFARGIRTLGYEIISSGGTFQALKKANIPAIEVSEFTGFPEILDGRVKTMHPNIHGGILFRRGNKEHVKQSGQYAIDLVAVNFYPFEETVRKTSDMGEIIENIDIGGPALVRAAGKNFEDVIVVANPSQYGEVLNLLQKGNVPKEKRMELAREAFSAVSKYDIAISNYFSSVNKTDFPQNLFLSLEKIEDLRYGENPHQKAANYKLAFSEFGFSDLEQLNGKQLSYNNILDIQAALELISEFRNSEKATAIIFKHTNPSGAAFGKTLSEAFLKAYRTDSLSAFGGIVALNKKLDAKTASLISEHFTEIVLAPDFEKEALEILKQKKNLRVLKTERLMNGSIRSEKDLSGKNIHSGNDFVFRSVFGGALVQTPDALEKKEEMKLNVVTKRKPTENEKEAMSFAWIIAKHVKSNAVVFSTKDHVVAIGAGQQSRVDSCFIAIEKAKRAKLSLKGTAMASDAFFPFRDTVDFAVQAGVTAIMQPGGSIRDEEVISAANEHNLAMVFTGIRHFKH